MNPQEVLKQDHDAWQGWLGALRLPLNPQSILSTTPYFAEVKYYHDREGLCDAIVIVSGAEEGSGYLLTINVVDGDGEPIREHSLQFDAADWYLSDVVGFARGICCLNRRKKRPDSSVVLERSFLYRFGFTLRDL